MTQTTKSELSWEKLNSRLHCCIGTEMSTAMLATRCGQKEDFKHACYWCPEALSLYTSTFQALSLTPKITISNLVLGHQRPHYIGAHQMESEKLEIIDLISTMTLGHILRARSSGSELSPPGLLISIKRHLRTIKMLSYLS